MVPWGREAMGAHGAAAMSHKTMQGMHLEAGRPWERMVQRARRPWGHVAMSHKTMQGMR